MDPITLAILGVSAATGAIITAFTKQYRKRKEAEKAAEAAIKAAESSMQALGQYANTYAFEPCDEKMIDGCRRKLDVFLGGQSFEQKVKEKETMAERREILKNLVGTMAEEMNVKVGNLIIEPRQEAICGYQSMDENGEITIFLNEALLVEDPNCLVSTVLHELRHAVQETSIYKENVWGFSLRRRAEWLASRRNYVDCTDQSTYFAYCNQIIEKDANSFADAVLNPQNQKEQ